MVRTYLGAASDGSTVAEERIGRLTGILVSIDDVLTVADERLKGTCFPASA